MPKIEHIDATSNLSNLEHKVRSRMPIYIKNVINFSAFNDDLTKITRLNRFPWKSTPSHLIIHSGSHFYFNKIVVNLN